MESGVNGVGMVNVLSHVEVAEKGDLVYATILVQLTVVDPVLVQVLKNDLVILKTVQVCGHLILQIN